MFQKASLSPGDQLWSEFPAFELWWSQKIWRYRDVLFALMVEKCRICFSLGKCLGFAVISSVFSTWWWNRDILAVKHSWHEVIGCVASSPLISEASLFLRDEGPLSFFRQKLQLSEGHSFHWARWRSWPLCASISLFHFLQKKSVTTVLMTTKSVKTWRIKNIRSNIIL